MDTLSDILQSLHLSGSLWCRTEAKAPWSMQLEALDLAHFHLIRRGDCWFSMEGMAEPLLLAGGDLIVLPHGQAHVLSDHPDTRPVPLAKLLGGRKPEDKGPLFIGGNGAPTTLICGYFKFDHGEVHPLFSLLPPLIHIRGEKGGAVPWLETTLNFIYSESDSERPGSQTMITRLADILFIQVIRVYLESLPQGSTGWLAGLKDLQIGKALAHIHRQPEKAWSLDSLSAAVGMSRASFAAKFKQIVGESPFQYLTRWRMYKAAGYLKEPHCSPAEAAERVGYRTASAFSKVFKRHLGVGPGKYRRDHQQDRTSA